MPAPSHALPLARAAHPPVHLPFAPLDATDWHTIVDAFQVFSGLATILAALVAVSAAIAAFLQIAIGRRAARENLALEAHREYLRLCIERPELSSSEAMLQHLTRSDFRGVLQEPLKIETERALWFVSLLLNTLEQLSETTRRWNGEQDPAWEAVIRAQVDYHRGLLTSCWPAWQEMYADTLRRTIDDELGLKAKEATLFMRLSRASRRTR